MNNLFKVICFYSFFLLTFGCAYKLSSSSDGLPGNIKTVFVHPFKNLSNEPGIEVYFTESIKKEILSSSLIVLKSSDLNSEGYIKGDITEIKIMSSDDSVIEATKDAKFLPYGTVLSTQVKVEVKVHVELWSQKENKLIWSSDFAQAVNYTPPQITLPVVNSANNLYNLSARRQTLESLAQQMMQLAYDRMVDNF